MVTRPSGNSWLGANSSLPHVTGGAIEPRNLARSFERIYRQARIRPIRSHDAELAILMRLAERGNGHEPDVLEMVTADFGPVIDPAIFRARSGSLNAAGFGQMIGGGGLPWRAAKTAGWRGL
jgi:hypothetical protein